MKNTYILFVFVSLCALVSCTNPQNQNSPVATSNAEDTSFDVAYEQYELANGLTVILHQDKSDPIVAMATIVHVGSNREKPGRTGFAHFFEHMSFNDSENVPKGSNRKLIPELGGTRNGGTWSDGTIYYEVVPQDAFDKLLWIDSDRLGYMINTVDQGTLEREKQVVKNEKRQRVDNRAYGHTGHVIKKNLYPEDHPYNWTVIGDLEDLQAASLEDVKEFYEQFYVPSNVTLVIAGDIDFAETRAKVERWFGEIKAGKPLKPIEPQHVTLQQNIKRYHLDNFAKLPEIRLTFPTVEQYHPDAYALDALAEILSDGKDSALYQTIVEQQKLAPAAYAWNSAEEVTGTFTLMVRANAGLALDPVYEAIQQALANFEKNGFTDNQLKKITAKQETNFYYEIESVLDKALQLGIYNEYAGSADFIKTDIANITAVTKQDIMRVYNRYIKDKAAIITSFVPKDALELVVTGSTKANVVEEIISQNAEPDFVENDQIEFPKTASKFDRSEPKLTQLPELKTPTVWQSQSKNGINILGIEQNELPVVNFSLQIKGGQSLDPKDKVGSAYILAELLNEGTKNKTPQQLEEAIGLLGATIDISSSRERISIEGKTLAKHFDATLALVSEMLLQPRWDESEFARIKAKRLTRIKQGQGNANTIAAQAFLKTVYGKNHLGGQPNGGTAQSVEQITLDDVKRYYQSNISPKNASLHVVGSVGKQQVNQALLSFQSWQGQQIQLPEQPQIATIDKPIVYFIDLPNAKQSVIYAGKTVVAADHPLSYPIEVANMRLGGGISARLAQTLRIQKGYTYGAYSYVLDALYPSTFIASSQVRSNVTLESLVIFKDLIGNYAATFEDEDLAVTQNMTIKGNSRRFETLNSLLNMLENISHFNRETDYVMSQQRYVQELTLDDPKTIIQQHLNEQQMIYVVVGDAKTQLERIKELGYGKPVILDIFGDKI